ncbi:MAG: conjugal transfer protein TraF [Candidatus Nanoarchaeia archaeon]|nr:conjugal transfer protein TraF [Candidatus Nanoarchaeia archaeon]
MVRELNKKRYLIAGIITAVIFLLGIMLGMVVEGQRVQYIDKVNRVEKLDYNSLQIQYAYIEQLSREENCEAVSKTFESSVKSLIETSERLESYEKNSNINKEEFKILKREYMLAQLNYWLLAQRTKNICDRDLVTILYFYSTDKECPRCGEQAFILTYLKQKFGGNLLIFSLDSTYTDEPMIEMLKQQYDIHEYPTLIIENRKVGGFSSKSEILSIICKEYSEKTSECEGYY